MDKKMKEVVIQVEGKHYMCNISPDAVPVLSDPNVLNGIGEAILNSGLSPIAPSDVVDHNNIIQISMQNNDIHILFPSEAVKSKSDEICSPPKKRPALSTPEKGTEMDNGLCQQLSTLSPFKVHGISTSKAHFVENTGTQKLSKRSLFHDRKTRFLEVLNMEPDFVKAHFVRAMNRECCLRGITQKNEAAIQQCSDFNADTSSVVIEFASNSVAEAISLWTNFKYDDNDVVFVQHFTEHPSEQLKSSKFLEVLNLEPDFIKEHFIRFLSKRLYSSGSLSKNEKAVVKCGDFNVVTNAVVLELASDRIVEEILSLGPFTYEGDVELVFRKFFADNFYPSVDHQPHFQRSSPSVSAPVEESCLGPDSSSSGTAKPFTNDKTIEALLRHCVKVKGEATRFVGTIDAYQKISSELCQKGVIVTADECRSKMKRLQEQFRRHPLNFKWRAYLSYLRGDSGAANPLLLPCDDDYSSACSLGSSKAELLAQYRRGVVWDVNSIHCLISVMLDLKEEFSNPHKDIAFWKVVSDKMKDQGVHVDPKMCQRKFDALCAEFKDYDDRRKCTGAGTVNWPFYEALAPLLLDNVSVEPLLTYSAGLVQKTTMNSTLCNTSTELRSAGRERTPLLGRPEDKKKLQQALVQSRRELTEVIRDLVQSCKKTP